MSYPKFKKLAQLRQQFGINDIQQAWLPTQFNAFLPSSLLLETLAEAAYEPLQTEKAKSESIVAPILKELRRKNPLHVSSFSGFELMVDAKRGLNGYCDFILASVPHKIELTSPIFCLVEAKKDNIEKGLAQCGAEMYAATLYNSLHETPKKVMYGCVTNAFSWCFLKLENNVLYIDPNYVPLTFVEPHHVLAVLQWILGESRNEK
jgi:hypothetical protein